jgi:hypothetical protein
VQGVPLERLGGTLWTVLLDTATTLGHEAILAVVVERVGDIR